MVHDRCAASATRLLVMRHGETAWNAAARIQGQLDIPLSPRGEQQAQRLAGRLAGEPIDAVYSSDLARAAQTAQPLARRLGLAPRPEPRLRERRFGLFEGSSYAEAEQRWPAEFARWRERDPDVAIPGGEAPREVARRVLAAVAGIVRAHPGATVAVFTHGGVLDVIYRAARRLPWQLPRTYPLHNAAINRVGARLLPIASDPDAPTASGPDAPTASDPDAPAAAGPAGLGGMYELADGTGGSLCLELHAWGEVGHLEDSADDPA